MTLPITPDPSLGVVLSLAGSVIEVGFPEGRLPSLGVALEVERNLAPPLVARAGSIMWRCVAGY